MQNFTLIVQWTSVMDTGYFIPSDFPCFSELNITNTNKMETDDASDGIISDDIILNLTNEDIFQEVGDPVRGSTPTPSTPGVPQPMANPPMLEELANKPPPFQFLHTGTHYCLMY